MAKQKVISGSAQPQIEVSPQALTSQLALFSPSFLSSYISLSSKNPNLTPWQLSCQHQVQVGVEKMQKSLDKKELHDINVKLLKNAIKKGEVEKVRSMLGEEIKLELSPEEATQLVKSAIDSDQVAIVDVLAKSNQININSFRYGGIPQGALDYAIRISRFGVAKVLANNSKINIASAEIASKVVNSIFSIVNEINETSHNKSEQDRQNPLEEIVQILVGRQIDVNIQNHHTRLTLLHQAIQYNNLSIFKVLLTHPNIDIQVQANCMLTPLDYAVGDDRFEMVEELLAKYCERGIIDTKYLTKALFHVQSREVFNRLVACGADIYAQVGTQSFDEKCNSDDQYFRKQKELLLEYVNGPNAKSARSSDPNTPFKLTIEANNTDIDSAVKSKQEVPEEEQDTDINLVGESKQEEVHEGDT